MSEKWIPGKTYSEICLENIEWNDRSKIYQNQCAFIEGQILRAFVAEAERRAKDTAQACINPEAANWDELEAMMNEYPKP